MIKEETMLEDRFGNETVLRMTIVPDKALRLTIRGPRYIDYNEFRRAVLRAIEEMGARVYYEPLSLQLVIEWDNTYYEGGFATNNMCYDPMLDLYKNGRILIYTAAYEDIEDVIGAL